MKVSCLKGVTEETSGFTAGLHVFKTDHPQCKGCVANYEGTCVTNTLFIQMDVCPRCGSIAIHPTQLHECPSGGTSMKCDRCNNTWCNFTGDKTQ